VRSFVAEFDSAVPQRIEEALAAGRDHGEIAASVLVRLFEGRVAVVDGRSGAVRRHAQDLFVTYIEDEDGIKEDLKSSAAELQQGGYHAQLAIGADSGVFLMEAGRRKSVTADQRAELLEMAKRDVELCAPGVVLRNLVQDSVFSPLAVVLGPAEIAYRAQIAPVYDRFSVAPPVAFPRLAATFIPPALTDLITGNGFDAETLVKSPASFKKAVFRSSTPVPVTAAAEAYLSNVDLAAVEFLRRAEAEVPQRLRGKLRTRLKDVSSRAAQTRMAIDEVGKGIALDKAPFLSELAELIRPEDKAQERFYSCLVPFLLCQELHSDSLVEIAADSIDDLLDRRAGHIVYSIKT
jgi:uncharacterized protein YllA (UPF0747 family)